MENPEATSWLEQFIGKNLRIHTTDNRIFGGQMKCTDKNLNIILALTYEYRPPTESSIRQQITSTSPTTTIPWSSRYVGLVVVPGEHVVKVEFEEQRWGGGEVVL